MNIIKKIKKKKLNVGHKLSNKNYLLKRYIKKIKLGVYYIKETIILYEIKKMFLFISKNLNKKILIISTKKKHLFIKKIFKNLKVNILNKWKNGFISKKKNSNKKIAIIIDSKKNYSAIKELIKCKYYTIVISDTRTFFEKVNIFIPMNDDDEKSIFFIFKQLYIYIKKIIISKSLKKNIFYICKKKKKITYIYKLFTENKTFFNKRYFKYKINKIKKNNIKKTIKKISNFYNEKIFFLGKKKIKNCKYILHDNKLVVSKEKNKKIKNILIHVILNIENLIKKEFNNDFFLREYNSCLNYIKKKKIKIKKVYIPYERKRI
ncbi:30S ribosomal protein S2 [Candidatus Vidania fulgoroideorum]